MEDMSNEEVIVKANEVIETLCNWIVSEKKNNLDMNCPYSVYDIGRKCGTDSNYNDCCKCTDAFFVQMKQSLLDEFLIK